MAKVDIVNSKLKKHAAQNPAKNGYRDTAPIFRWRLLQ